MTASKPNTAKAHQTATASAPAIPVPSMFSRLTDVQVIMLEVLRKAGGVEMTVSEFEAACSSTAEPYSRRAYRTLRQAGFIDTGYDSVDGQPRLLGLTISAKGRKALHMHYALVQQKACVGFTPPRTYTNTEPYNPPANVY